MRQNRPKKKKIQSYQLWDPAPNLQHRWPFSSACLSPQHLRLLLQPEEKQQNSQGCKGCKQKQCDCLQFHHFQLGLFEGGFIGNNVVFLMEGVKQEKLVPLRATAHQSTGLWRNHRRQCVIKPNYKQYLCFVEIKKAV